MSEHTRRLRCPINRQDSDAGHLCQSRIVVLSMGLAHGPGNHLVITQAAAPSRKDPPPERTSEGAIPASRDARRSGRAGRCLACCKSLLFTSEMSIKRVI